MLANYYDRLIGINRSSPSPFPHAVLWPQHLRSIVLSAMGAPSSTDPPQSPASHCHRADDAINLRHCCHPTQSCTRTPDARMTPRTSTQSLTHIVGDTPEQRARWSDAATTATTHVQWICEHSEPQLDCIGTWSTRWEAFRPGTIVRWYCRNVQNWTNIHCDKLPYWKWKCGQGYDYCKNQIMPIDNPKPTLVNKRKV